ncbi:MAG: hypothetical protein KA191_05420, partial [Verrucomicrobia bacterium]|nr:hypothetical protein [Verrucomicrobiota bacterium]
SLQPRQIIARERAALDADRFHCAHDLPQWPFRVQQKNVQTPGRGQESALTRSGERRHQRHLTTAATEA